MNKSDLIDDPERSLNQFKDEPAKEAGRSEFEAAQMMLLIQITKSAEAKELVSRLSSWTLTVENETARRMRKRTRSALDTFKDTLAALLADLLLHSCNSKSHGYGYFSKDDENLKKTKAHRSALNTIIDCWKVMELIDVQPFTFGRTDWGDMFSLNYRKSSRYRATPAMTDLCGEFGVNRDNLSLHFEEDPVKASQHSAQREALTLKSNNELGGEYLIAFQSNPESERLKAEVVEINSFLAMQTFSPIAAPWFQRKFNNGTTKDYNLDQGGRLYAIGPGNYQNRSSEFRRSITINGSPTVELDIRASQISIFYGLIGSHWDEWDIGIDPYSIPGIERDLVKQVVVQILGAGRVPGGWGNGFGEKYSIKHKIPIGNIPRWKKVLPKVLELHPELANIGAHGLNGEILSFKESEAIIGVMLDLKRRFTVPSLPVYDCLIVPSENEELTVDLLRHAYEARFGCKVEITRK